MVAILVALTAYIPSNLDSENTEYAFMMVRIHTSDNHAVIAYSNGETDRIELKNYQPKNNEMNAISISKILNDMSKNGYKLVEANGAGESTTYYIFEK